MLVSRKDITHEHLMDYPIPFLKVPVKNYLRELHVEPRPSQVAIINAINNPKYRFIVAAISRRQGKTYIANIIGQIVSLIPNCHILIISPNYGLSEISFKLQRQLISHFELEVTRNNAKDRIIELGNGSSIRMGSINQVDSCVGRSYNLIIFDEAALSANGEDAFNVSLMPTLDQEDMHGNSMSKVLFISTPRGKRNWFSGFYDRGFPVQGQPDEFPEWISIHATHLDNPATRDDDITAAVAGMTEQQFAQEFMADFSIFEGQVWDFNTEMCIQDLSHLETHNMEVFAGLDIGYRDPTAMCVIAYDWDEEKFYVINEYYDAEKTTDIQAEAISKLVDTHRVDSIFIDSAHPQVRFDFAQLYDLSTINAKKDRNQGITYVADIVYQNKLIVDSRCVNTIDSLMQYQWDPNPNLVNEKPIHNKFCHMADAIRYGLYSFNVYTPSF